MSDQRIITYRPEIRFADVDSMGHVNNAVYLTYFEQARMNYFNHLIEGKWDWHKDGILVARNEVDYRLPIFLNDSIEIEVSCGEVGNKSFVMTYQVVRAQTKEIVTSGKSILVSYDHQAKKSVRVPDEWTKLFNVAG